MFGMAYFCQQFCYALILFHQLPGCHGTRIRKEQAVEYICSGNPRHYISDTDKKNISEIIIAKQRNGPIGTVELVWLPNYTKFANKSKK